MKQKTKPGGALQPSSDFLAAVSGAESAAGRPVEDGVEMPMMGKADGKAPGRVSSVAEALGEMLAPPELMSDDANDSDECADEENAGAAEHGGSEESDTDDGSDAEDAFALSACRHSDLEKKYHENFL